jgi:hypothetical protein
MFLAKLLTTISFYLTTIHNKFCLKRAKRTVGNQKTIHREKITKKE